MHTKLNNWFIHPKYENSIGVYSQCYSFEAYNELLKTIYKNITCIDICINNLFNGYADDDMIDTFINKNSSGIDTNGYCSEYDNNKTKNVYEYVDGESIYFDCVYDRPSNGREDSDGFGVAL